MFRNYNSHENIFGHAAQGRDNTNYREKPMTPFRWSVLATILVLFLLAQCRWVRTKITAPEASAAPQTYTRVLVPDARLDEVSGIVASRQFPGVLWVHNDSGDKPRIFAIDTSGQTLGSVMLDGKKAYDWEDIAIGPGPRQGTEYLYIGDIGDNYARRSVKSIFRIAEPNVAELKKEGSLTVHQIDTIRFRFPDGPRDCETLLCDPLTKNLYVLSKRENRVHVYELPFPQDTREILVAKKIAELPLTQLTAGDISPDGRFIILKNYVQVFLFKRSNSQSVASAFAHFPDFLPYVEEPQGEAICFAADEDGYFTISEKSSELPLYLYFYPRHFAP